MIEFTIFELTLSILCVGLFIYGFQQNRRVNELDFFIEAICRDKYMYEELCKAAREADEEVV